MRGRKREELWEEREAWRAFKKRAGCVDGLRPPGPKKKKKFGGAHQWLAQLHAILVATGLIFFLSNQFGANGRGNRPR